LNQKESQRSYFKREELRGLFVLGLLAVVASVRIQSKNITFIINGNPYDVAVFLDIMLITWSFYAFFMILGLSEDIIGKKSADLFREVSTQYLYLSFVILASLSIVFLYFVYPTRTPYAIGFLVVACTYWFIRKLIQIRKTFRFSFGNLWKRAKRNLYQLLLSAFIVCFILVMFGTREDLVIPSFIIGSACLLSFLIIRERLIKRGIIHGT
jgi:hypothetical protein